MWCDRCKGGFIECSKCDTTGYIECPTCEGTTIATCETCRGTNKITKIAQICVTTTPKYAQSYQDGIDEKIKAFIEKHITQNIAEIANITRTELRQDEKERRVVEIYQIQVPFAKFNLTFDNQKIAWLVCGKNLQVETDTNEMLQALKVYEVAQKAEKQRTQEVERQRQNKAKWAKRKKILLIIFAVWFGLNIVAFIIDKINETIDTPKQVQSSGMQTPQTQTRQTPPQPMTRNSEPSPSGEGLASASDNFNVASSNTASSSVASENSSPAINQSENSSVASIRLKTNDEYVNLRKAPSGEVLTPI